MSFSPPCWSWKKSVLHISDLLTCFSYLLYRADSIKKSEVKINDGHYFVLLIVKMPGIRLFSWAIFSWMVVCSKWFLFYCYWRMFMKATFVKKHNYTYTAIIYAFEAIIVLFSQYSILRLSEHRTLCVCWFVSFPLLDWKAKIDFST